MRVVHATDEDVPSWLDLAAEVEHLFGPLVDDPGFRRALAANVERSQAHCMRKGDGPPGTPLLGGLIFDERFAPEYHIRWLAVSARHRRQGAGRCLLEGVLARASRPSSVSVVTFGEDVAAGEPARSLYRALGFAPYAPAEPGPEGGSRQVLRLALDGPDAGAAGMTHRHYVPDGWQTVTPRIVAEAPEDLVGFLRTVFDATGDYHAERPTELRIGDSIVMISGSSGRDLMPAFLYVYVEDTDATYRRALDAGATSIEDPREMPYGDRRAMVRDSWGNTWQIATHGGRFTP